MWDSGRPKQIKQQAVWTHGSFQVTVEGMRGAGSGQISEERGTDLGENRGLISREEGIRSETEWGSELWLIRGKKRRWRGAIRGISRGTVMQHHRDDTKVDVE